LGISQRRTDFGIPGRLAIQALTSPQDAQVYSRNRFHIDDDLPFDHKIEPVATDWNALVANRVMLARTGSAASIYRC